MQMLHFSLVSCAVVYLAVLCILAHDSWRPQPPNSYDGICQMLGRSILYACTYGLDCAAKPVLDAWKVQTLTCEFTSHTLDSLWSKYARLSGPTSMLSVSNVALHQH